MPFKLILHRKVVKEIKRLPEPIHSRVIEALKELAENPFASDVKPLEGAVSVYRRRVGDYRIIFHVDFKQNVVFVSLVEHRSSVYKNF
ncbi:plasmid stabilization system [mine drainage metagenome]|uniref:Addiction module toxin, RelE/StbE family n=1 Tax=mine drainage metagenome TaxID=410659 RepID=T1C4E1_9ZZZZ